MKEVQRELNEIRISSISNSHDSTTINFRYISIRPDRIAMQYNSSSVKPLIQVETVMSYENQGDSEASSKPDIKDLVKWAIMHNITQSALSDLLGVLRSWCPELELPKDPRTLLSTPRSVSLSILGNGQFFHFGVKTHLIKFLETGSMQTYRLPEVLVNQGLINLLTLKVGIDGLPISKSSNLQFWPILVKIDQDASNTVSVVSLYCGEEKPSSLDEFLGPFVSEMLELESAGVESSGKLYQVRIRCVVADAPARSFIKAIKKHNAYYGCERCYRKGKWLKRVTYPVKVKADLYTDDTFKDKTFPNHHNGLSPLEKLCLGMITQIPLD